MLIMKETNGQLLTLRLEASAAQVSLDPIFLQYTFKPTLGYYVVSSEAFTDLEGLVIQYSLHNIQT
jgi:hypothetical protein